MFGICLRYTRSNMDAEDLLHEAFIRVIDNLNNYRGDGPLDAWLRRIMVTTAINYYNKYYTKGFDVEIEDNIIENKNKNDVYSQLSEQEILKMIQKIPDGYRLIFNMYVVEGYKHVEIAEMLNISINTSKSQLMKARRLLMKLIEEQNK